MYSRVVVPPVPNYTGTRRTATCNKLKEYTVQCSTVHVLSHDRNAIAPRKIDNIAQCSQEEPIDRVAMSYMFYMHANTSFAKHDTS